MNGPLSGRNVLLGVTGSIAAFKAADIASGLAGAGASVHVVMTKAATSFISPLVFRALTGRPVRTEMFAREVDGHVEHISLARLADLFLVAPATANFIGKYACGIADDLLSVTAMSTTAPAVIAPAMNCTMYESDAVRENLRTLRARGVEVIEPEVGRLACGEDGKGRLASVETIIGTASVMLSRAGTWKGRHVLVTAGPTREPIDAIRHISNPSSGRMGHAVARAAVRRGADVVLVTGPTGLADPPAVQVVRVTTSEEMRRAVLERFEWAHLVIKAAAVTDYRPESVGSGKTKEREWQMRLVKVPNILEELSARRNGQILVGFCAENGDPQPEAERKSRARGLDLMVANDVSGADSGFGSENNRAILIHDDGRSENLPLMRKSELAERILDSIEPKFRPQHA